MVDILEEDAKKQGYTPDASVAGDEVINSTRPKPFMVYRKLDLMNVNPIQSVVRWMIPFQVSVKRLRPAAGE
jgi:phosphonoacetaldehyde hydrolase